MRNVFLVANQEQEALILNGNPARLLIAEDDSNLRKVLKIELTAEGFQVSEANNGQDAVNCMQREEFDVLLLDLNMPGLPGLDVLRKVKELDLPLEVVVLTADASVAKAVEAMRRGACDYLNKPVKVDELVVVLQKACEKKSLLHEVQLLRSQVQRDVAFPGLITQNQVMLQLLADVKSVALAGVPVHIHGESGVGKDLIARGIHAASGRAERSYIAINCSALTESVFESEIFGYEKGAFTGAANRKPGLLELADRGTFFIDEIGEMPVQLQAKLLRALETGAFYRVGGVREVKVDARVVSASNRDLRQECEAGAFRKDLFWRISTISLHVPPLRERKEDIPALVEHFLHHLPSSRPCRISRAALQLLHDYDWPGNVRELQNVIQRATLLRRGDMLEPTDFTGLSSAVPPRPVNRRLDEVEKAHILETLRETGGHRGRASAILGLDPKTLYRKLRNYQIDG